MALANLCKVSPEKHLEDLFIPLLTNEVERPDITPKARSLAAKTIILISRAVPEQQKRDDIVASLLSKLLTGNDTNRVVLVECNLYAIDVYSEEAFSKLFATPALSLATDSVATVRRELARALPQLTPWCQSHLLFESVLAHLQSDTDPGVLDAMRSFVVEASKHVRLSRMNAQAAQCRRVEELALYSNGAESSSAFLSKSFPSVLVTALASGIGAPLSQLAQQPGRLGRKVSAFFVETSSTTLANNALIAERENSFEADAARLADIPAAAQNHELRDPHQSLEVPLVLQTDATESAAGAVFENHVSAISWLTASPSGDHSVSLNGGVTAQGVGTKSDQAPNEEQHTAGEPGSTFSAILSGSIDSLGMPSTRCITRAFSRSANILPVERSWMSVFQLVEAVKEGHIRTERNLCALLLKYCKDSKGQAYENCDVMCCEAPELNALILSPRLHVFYERRNPMLPLEGHF
jgi:hypothetical protein